MIVAYISFLIEPSNQSESKDVDDISCCKGTVLATLMFFICLKTLHQALYKDEWACILWRMFVVR
jgi:hypothetical protein